MPERLVLFLATHEGETVAGALVPSPFCTVYENVAVPVNPGDGLNVRKRSQYRRSPARLENAGAA